MKERRLMTKFSAFLIAFLVMSIGVYGQVSKDSKDKEKRKSMKVRKYINPTELPASPAYSHGVSVKGGRTIYISGQIAINSNGELVGKGDLGKQAEQVFENIKIVLNADGARFSDVVKLTYFVKNYKPDDLQIIRQVRNRYLPSDKPLPASSLVGVQTLAKEDLLIEIEAIAVIQEGEK